MDYKNAKHLQMEPSGCLLDHQQLCRFKKTPNVSVKQNCLISTTDWKLAALLNNSMYISDFRYCLNFDRCLEKKNNEQQNNKCLYKYLQTKTWQRNQIPNYKMQG